MKAKLLYAILAMSGTVGFVVFQVGFAGDKHVTVVKENLALYAENTDLRAENADLKEENAALDSLAGGALDSFETAMSQAVSYAIDSTQEGNRKKFENQINSLKDELQQAKDDLHDLDVNGRRIPLGPVK
jgi:regulator of replication initiation timing